MIKDGYYIAFIGNRRKPVVLEYDSGYFYEPGRLAKPDPETVRIVAPVNMTPKFEYRVEWKFRAFSKNGTKYINPWGAGPWHAYHEGTIRTLNEARAYLETVRAERPSHHHKWFRIARRPVADQWECFE